MLTGTLRRHRLRLSALALCSVVTSGVLALAPASQAVDDAHITGTVTDLAGAGLEDIEVTAHIFDPAAGDHYTHAGSVATDADGHYDLGGLAAGTYRVDFLDHDGAYVGEAYDNKRSSSTSRTTSWSRSPPQ